jgi:hypothetical protein
MIEKTNQRNTPATTAFVLSLCGVLAQPVISVLVLCGMLASKMFHAPEVLLSGAFFLPAFLGLVAVILGHQGKGIVRRDPSLPGKSMATAGMIIGYALLAHMVLSRILVLLGSHLLKAMD